MGKIFKNLVESMNDCKYVPVGTRCSVCQKRLNFFTTGFWSVNTKIENRHLSDGVLCAKCYEKAEHFIKTKKKWMSKELQSQEKWKKFSTNNMAEYSSEDIRMLAEQKEISDKENLSSYGEEATGIFEVKNSFGLYVGIFNVGITRAEKINRKTVLFGNTEEGVFQKGDSVKIDNAGKTIETKVLEAHRLNRNVINGRKMDTVFFETLSANMIADRKIKENQEGWLIVDLVWQDKMNDCRVIKSN